ncbi:unnamed protein product [Peniophora sp. CBMAI 1063]|nr:unnamed protein product [Peniophora sp. CBMAI 1063]
MFNSQMDWLNRVGYLTPAGDADLIVNYTGRQDLFNTRPSYHIGRGTDVQIKVHPSRLTASMLHAILRWDAESNVFTLEDCLSSNGTYVNGFRLNTHERLVLRNGDHISLGPPCVKVCGFIYHGLLDLDDFVQDYAVQRSLGIGGHGQVYEMRLRVCPSQVFAVKVMTYDADDHGRRSQASALEEVRALRLVGNHPNICPLVADYVLPEQRVICMVMPSYTVDLRKRFASCRPTVLEGRSILSQLLSALEHLRRVNLVHQDIKPPNILVEGDQVILADFGISALADVAIKRPARGTPTYAAPETMGPKRFTDAFKIDVYSVGLTVIHLFMDVLAQLWSAPHPGYRSLEKERNWFHSRRLNLVPIAGVHLPEEATAVLFGLIDVDPEKRWSASRALESPWLTLPTNL